MEPLEASISFLIICICFMLWALIGALRRQVGLLRREVMELQANVARGYATYEDPTLSPPPGYPDDEDMDVESAMTDFAVPCRGLDDNENEA